MVIRKYVVSHKRGHIEVSVADSVIELRGERQAVIDAAWRKFMGLNNLGEVVDKSLRTRKIIKIEIGSRYQHQRTDVYDRFRESVTIKWVGVEHVRV